jgi:hypothetical protein
MDPTYPKSLALHSHPPDDTCGKKEETLVKEEEGLPTVDEDRLDALIAELEEEDGKEPDPEVLTIGPGADRPIPAILLETSLTTGLTDVEVTGLRRKYGWNRLNEQKKSNLVKFFKLFVGSVQFVMEVSTLPHTAVAISSAGKLTMMLCRLLLSWPLACKTGSTSVSSVHSFSSTPSWGLLKSTMPATLSPVSKRILHSRPLSFAMEKWWRYLLRTSCLEMWLM